MTFLIDIVIFSEKIRFDFSYESADDSHEKSNLIFLWKISNTKTESVVDCSFD